MTTIAFSSGIMAADSRASDNDARGVFVTKCQKIYRLANNCLLGTAGDDDSREVQALLGKCKGPKSLPTRAELAATRTDFAGILVFPKGQIYLIDIRMREYEHTGEWSGEVLESRERYAATGSGQEFALGAMAHGASAAQAVAIAAKFDLATGGPIVSVALKK